MTAMTFRERMEKRFGSPLPGYIERDVKMREAGTARRARQEREAKERKEAEHARIRALRRPPQNVRLVKEGRLHVVYFEPPETADQLEFAGFWVSEERNGEWTKHGDYVLKHVRKATLYGSGPCYVETWYHQMALGEMYRSPIVHAEPAAAPSNDAPKRDMPPEASPNAELVETVRGYLKATGRPPGYYERWTRVLAGLGAEEHDDPMTADEAQSYVDRGWGDRWPPIVAALREIEGK